MTEVRRPLVCSAAGHAVGLFLLAWLSTRLPPIRLQHPAVPNAIEVVFATPQPPVAEVKPPPPAPPATEVKPPPPEPEVKPPPPPKPQIRRPVERRVPPPPRPAAAPPLPARAPPIVLPPPQTATLPPPAPRPTAAPMVSAGYRSALSRWFATHNHYPASALERGEEGQAVLRVRVDRSGRVLSFAVVRSTGYHDLDAAVEAMMRDAVLPPFPGDMAAADIEVSVPVRFSIAR